MYFFVIIATLCYLFYLHAFNNKYKQWKDSGVKGPAPLPFFGNFAQVMTSKEHISRFMKRIYENFPEEKVVGLYRGFDPVLLIREPDLIKQVLIKDFHLFQDRGAKLVDGVISDNLFSSEGETWRILRQKMTPLFTSGKLQNMTPLMNNCIDRYINYVNDLVESNIDEEIRSVQSKLTLEIIGACGFGLDLRVFFDHDNEFTKAAEALLSRSLKFRIWFALEQIFPGIKNKMSYFSNTTKHYEDFFVNLVKSIIVERDGKPSMRKDFMDLMIELRDQGKASRREENGVSEIEINEGIIAAQAFVFYFAGFETSAATTSFLLHELALHPDIQERVYNEIAEVSRKHNNEINYDSILEMKYLEMVLDETLRKYPVVAALIRKSSSDYTFPGTKATIKKGQLVFVSPYGLHYDERYFPNPLKFDPERFSSENKTKIPSCVYMPFGEGPRNCIGMRFAKVASMIGLAAFLNYFAVAPSEKTQDPLKYNPKGITLTSESGIWLKISKRRK